MKIALSVLIAAATLAQGADLYFPPSDGSRWETVSPADAGWDAELLDAALEFAGERRSSGVVVLYRGRILGERYWDLGEPRKGASREENRYFLMRRGKDSEGRVIEDVASVQKSVAAELVGIAQHKGLLKIDDPVGKHLGQGWSEASREQEARITVRHLLTMTSGLTDRLEYAHEPGTVWRYNTAAYARSVDVVAATAKRDRNEVTREWLTGPIGMANSRWAERPWARGRADAANRYGFLTTARELARFGLLVLAGGSWAGKTVLPDTGYLRASISPSQELNPSYGYLWWLNGQPFAVRGTRRVPGWLIPPAPGDLVAALGALGRKLYVVPSLGLVVTRLGDDPEQRRQERFDNGFWKRLMAAAPSR